MNSPIWDPEIQTKHNQTFFKVTGVIAGTLSAALTAAYMSSAGFSILATVGASVAAGAAGFFILPPVAFCAVQVFIAIPIFCLFVPAAGAGCFLLHKNWEWIKSCFNQYENA